MKDLISIIIPVYNVEKYLNRCVDSIINQTYKNLEIILIDDGSKDSSSKICDEYEKKDDRITVIHQINKGLSEARNKGVEISSGQYLFFVDSDDSLELDTIEYLYNGSKKYGTDITCCGLSNIYLNNKVEKVTILDNICIFTKEDALKIHLLPGYIETITCNKLFSRKLFDNVRWPKGKLYEDMRTTYKLLNECEKIAVLPDSKYNYFKRSNSIGGTSFNERTLDILAACDEAVNFVTNNYGDCDEIRISQLHWYIVVVNKMIISDCVDQELVRKIKILIKKAKRGIKKTKYLPRIRKIQMLLFYYNFGLYKIIYKKYITKKR